MKKILLIFLLLISLSFNGQITKILFLGNSYTGNHLPSMFRELCRAGGDSVYVRKNTPGGCSLAAPPNSHLSNQTSLDLIFEGIWDYVILQEQSQMPTIPYYRSGFFFPGAKALDSLIKKANSCTRTMFYMTWGRKNGGEQCIGSYCSPVFVDYEHMQDSLEAAYMRNAEHISASVSPVGISWKNSIENGDPIDLFAPDYSHPSDAGFYLSACTFYSSIFLESPVGIDYYAGLDPDDALYLQQVAEHTVLTDPGQWYLSPLVKPVAGFEYEINSDTVFFTDTSQYATHYLWNFGDGNTDTTQNPFHVYSQSGFYEVTQMVYDSCNADSTNKIINVVVSKIDEKKAIEFNIFPNPAKEIVTIEMQDARCKIQDARYRIQGDLRFEIVDLMGRVAKNGILDDDRRIRLSDLRDGIYAIHILNDRMRIHSSKIVVQH